MDRIGTSATWTGDVKKTFDLLKKELARKKYAEFAGDCRTYGLQTKGSAAIYLVPEGQTGKLKSFAGKRVRIVCLGPLEKWPGYSGRRYAVGVV